MFNNQKEKRKNKIINKKMNKRRNKMLSNRNKLKKRKDIKSQV